METKHPSTANRSYEDFDPVCKWRREEGRDTLEVHLPGFRKEHVKVQVNHLGFIIISGERPLVDGTRWRRFKKEIEIPTYCDENAIHANFRESILTVVMPKKVSPISYEDQERQIPEFEPQKDKRKDKETDQNMEFTGRHTREETESTGSVKDDMDEAEDEFEGESAKSTPETTREVAFKILVVVIVILVIGSYVADVCKSILANSYFLN